jgi:hypothetical protein
MSKDMMLARYGYVTPHEHGLGRQGGPANQLRHAVSVLAAVSVFRAEGDAVVAISVPLAAPGCSWASDTVQRYQNPCV